MKASKILSAVILICLSFTAQAEDFFQEYISARLNSLNEFQNDYRQGKDLKENIQKHFPLMSKADRDFLYLRLNLYGLSDFKVDGTRMILKKDSEQSIDVVLDFAEFSEGKIKVNQKFIQWNLSGQLKSFFLKNFQPQFEDEENKDFSSWQALLLFPFSILSGCEKMDNYSKVNAGLLGLSAASYCLNPIGAAAGQTIGAACAGVYTGCSEKSFKKGMSAFCNNLPGVSQYHLVNEGTLNNHPSHESDHSK